MIDVTPVHIDNPGAAADLGGSDVAELSDEETAALTQELHDTVENDRYPFSPRIRTLRAILNKLRPSQSASPCISGS